MAALVECVPNFSEGRDAAVVDRIVTAMVAVPGVRLLDRSMDAGHHRSVVTILGSPDAVGEAAFRGVAEAARLIDLRTHRGEHPRMGAADVVPFIPIWGFAMVDCVALARRVGDRIGRELAIPVYLYEEAATRPERRNLAEVRGPQFEGLLPLVGTDPSRQPDFGPAALHPSAGAVAVGARTPLVAYNIYLNTPDQKVAAAIARAVRHQTGGLRYVKALGIAPNEWGRVHVSMNLTNTEGTPIHRVLEMVRAEASRYGVAVVESEIVGLVSADALLDAAEYYLQLNSFSRSQVLEYRLLEDGDPSSRQHEEAKTKRDLGTPQTPPGAAPWTRLLGAGMILGTPQTPPGRDATLATVACPGPASSLPPQVGEGAGDEGESSAPWTRFAEDSVAGFSERVASSSATPGGGSVAALMGALAVALVAMVSRLTLGRKRFAGAEQRLKEMEARAEALRARLLELMEADSAAYLAYMAAARNAKAGAPGAKEALAEASLRAAEVPLESGRAALEALEMARDAAALGNPVARTDALVAAAAAHAAVLGAALNVQANLPLLKPGQRTKDLEIEAASLEQQASLLLKEALATR